MTQAAEAAAAIEGRPEYVQGNPEFRNLLLCALLTNHFTEVSAWLGADEVRVDYDSTNPGTGMFIARFADGSSIEEKITVWR